MSFRIEQKVFIRKENYLKFFNFLNINKAKKNIHLELLDQFILITKILICIMTEKTVSYQEKRLEFDAIIMKKIIFLKKRYQVQRVVLRPQ